MPSLAETLAEVRRRIRRVGTRSMNEENTKATLIEPVLRALGWDVEDVDEVQREFKTQPRHKPVDYGLLVVRTPRLLIEAKALGEVPRGLPWITRPAKELVGSHILPVVCALSHEDSGRSLTFVLDALKRWLI